MRLVVDVEIRREAGRVFLPGERRVRRRINSGQHVVGMRPLPGSPNRSARKARPRFEHAHHAVGRDHFRLGRPVDVDKLHEQEFDTVPFEPFAKLLGYGRHGTLPVG